MSRIGPRRVRQVTGETMRLADFLGSGQVIPDLAATTKQGVMAELVGRLPARQPGIDRDELCRRLLERERLGSTGIGGGVAIPHAKLPHVGPPLVVFGRSRTGIAFDSLDGRPVHLFFLLIADEESVDLHLRLLAGISRMLKNRSLRCRLLEAADSDTLYGIIEEQDNRL
jgi:PTS system nitrogen regulatory IIA component